MFVLFVFSTKRETQMERKLDSEPKSYLAEKIESLKDSARIRENTTFLRYSQYGKTLVSSQCIKVVFANDFTSYLFAGTLRKFERVWPPRHSVKVRGERK